MRLKRGLAGGAAAVLLAGAGLSQDMAGANLDHAARGVRGGVAMLALAQDLYGLGLAQKDALTVLAAARLAGSVEVRMIARHRVTEAAAGAVGGGAVGGGTVSGGGGSGGALPMGADAMLAVARGLAGEDETIGGLIEAAAAARVFGQAELAQATAAQLAAGGVDQWRIPLFGGAYAEIAVLGNGTGNLDVAVTDENGHAVCLDVGWTDRIYCDFTPAENGYFTVRVENLGASDNRYRLLTN